MSGDHKTKIAHGHGPEQSRRSVRKRSFNKEYDVDFARLLGGSHKTPRTGLEPPYHAPMLPHLAEDLATAYDGMTSKPHLTVTTETCGNTADCWSDLIMEHFGHQALIDNSYAKATYGSPTMPFSYTDNLFEDEQPAMLEMPMSGFHGYDTQLIGGMSLPDYLHDHTSSRQDTMLLPQPLQPATTQLDPPTSVTIKTEPQHESPPPTLETTPPPTATATTPHAPPTSPKDTPPQDASSPTPNAQPADASAPTNSPSQQTDGTPAIAPSSPLPTPKLSPDQAVLVAKILTKSDASSKRVILPRVSVEANMPWIVGVPNYQLTVHDTEHNEWKFIVKSWSNGENPKPVYVVEQISDYMRIHKLGPGDAVGIVGDSQGKLTIMANTEEVREAALRPQYSAYALKAAPKEQPADSAASSSDTAAARDGVAALPTLLHSQQGGALAIHSNGYLLCPRTPGCNRPAGHQGWCSGHKGFKRRSNHK